MRKFFTWALLALLAVPAFADEADGSNQGDYTYKLKTTPQHIDNYLFTVYFSNGKKAYNLRDLTIANPGNEVEAIKINPSGASFALLSKNKKGETNVAVYNLWQSNKQLFNFKDIKNAEAIAFTPDARELLIAVPGQILRFDARTFEPKGEIVNSTPLTDMVMSPNGYYLAGITPQAVTVWDFENGVVRKQFEPGEAIKDAAFSADNNYFAILTADGLLTTYGTLDFLINQSLDGLGDALSLSYHPDGKFMSVVTGDNRIAVVNLMDDSDRTYVENETGGIKDARFLRDGKKQTFLTYNTASSIIYKLMDALPPNYTKLLSDELEERMNEWMKQLPDETLDEYKLRVNEESRMAQMKLFEQEIATRMADNLVGMSEVTLGNYNTDEGMLAISFNNMPEIFLNVPANELNDFMDGGQLEFRNAKYGLTPQDKFELIYAEVYNRKSGKSYVYDNLERKNMDYLTTGDGFVPLEVVQQSNLEELVLQDIKDKIVNLARENKTISDHTHITVNANVVNDHDASGKKQINYQIDFAYEVEPGFSAKEDFAPGKYHVGESGAASSMLSIVKDAFENDFKQYVKAGKKLKVNISGMADALPINGKIRYDGAYGDFVDEPVRKNGDLSSITVTKAGGITQNEQLALVRAAGVRDYLTKNVPSLSAMNPDYNYNIELTDGKGGEYRRIKVEFIFVDAF